MQLTDDEIRAILLRQKRLKKRRQQRRRRITVLVLLVLLIALALFIKFYPKAEEAPAPSEPPRGTIFIDPGHGGNDPGSDNGARYEKEDTLKLGLALKKELEKANFHVEMSRTEDTSVDRTKRGEMANACEAKLMVSIHRNKADGDGNGIEAFIPKADDASSRMLAENILHALGEQGFAERTVRAGTLQSSSEDYEETGTANMPCCLVEVGFISNSSDNSLFDNNLNANAKAMAAAIDKTFIELYEPDKAGQETVSEDDI